MTEKEPLKGKVTCILDLLEQSSTSELSQLGEAKIVFIEDVKSAVKGFISDLEAEKVAIFPDTDGDGYEVLYDEEGDFVRFETVIKLLKKWFPDVFEDENEK